MREIRFRAWDEIGKQMFHFDNPFRKWDVSKIPDYEVWMQFTGLKDKSGKEIYEGDILRYEHDCPDFGPCTHPQWDYKEVKCDGQCFYTHTVWTKDENNQGVLYARAGTVIGNIYENPELLTPAH